MTTPVYPESIPVGLTVAYPLWLGTALTPTAVSRVVTDQAGVIISDTTAVTVPAPGPTSISIPISSVFNTLAMGSTDGLRQVTTTMVTSQGTFTDVQTYILRSVTPLVRMDNSFVALPETALVRHAMTNLSGWDAASEDDRIAAMISAYRNMTQLRFRFPIGEKTQSRIVDFYGMSVDNVFGRIFVVIADIIFYSDADFQQWPADFRSALQRAQMAEADNLLQGDPIGVKRAAGIIGETIGESTMNFRKIPEIQTPVSRAALIHLRGYLDSNIMVARA
jgi:hypothetical protein